MAGMINHLDAATAQGYGKTRHIVGELNDLPAIETAVSAAEAGHVVFGTLHTNRRREPSTASSTSFRSINRTAFGLAFPRR